MLTLFASITALSMPLYSVERLTPLTEGKPSSAYGISHNGTLIAGMSRDMNNTEIATVWVNGKPRSIQSGYTARKITDDGGVLLLNQERTKVAFYSDQTGTVPLASGNNIYADMNRHGHIVVGGNNPDNTRFDFSWSAASGRKNLDDLTFRVYCIGGNNVIGGNINWISTLLFPNNNILFIYMYGTIGSKVLSISDSGRLTFNATFPGGLNKSYVYTYRDGAESYGMMLSRSYIWSLPPTLKPVQINDSGTVIGEYGNDVTYMPFIKFANTCAMEFNLRLASDSKNWYVTKLFGENEEDLIGEAVTTDGVKTAVVLHPLY